MATDHDCKPHVFAFVERNFGNHYRCRTPILTVAASPSLLWPPDGRMVSVTVSGTISGANLAPQATFSVHDEYGVIQPTGTTTIGSGGTFSFPILLQASRQDGDLNGRRY